MFVLTLPRSMLWWARPSPEGGNEGRGRGVWTGEEEHRWSGTTRDRAKGWQGIGGRSQPLLYGVTRAYARGFVSLRREGSLPGPRGGATEPTHDLAPTLLPLDLRGYYSYPREP